MKRKFWVVPSSLVLVLVLVGVVGVSGLFGSGDAYAYRLSIPAAAFQPWKSGDNYAIYENHGRFLKHLGSGPGIPAAVGKLDGYWYIAPISLPDGAMVSKVIAHWYQETPVDHGHFNLGRSEFGKDTFVDLVAIDSTGVSGYGPTFTTTIGTGTQAVVDNSRYAYWVLFQLPVSKGTIPGINVWGCGAQIEFGFPDNVYLPVITR